MDASPHADETVIRISEQGRGSDGSFFVTVSFGEYARYDTQVTDIADLADEENFTWYFERHLRYPFLDQDREKRTVQSISDYGKLLFREVFGGQAECDYRRLRDRSFSSCRLEVEGSAAMQRLHWETLRDPDLEHPLAISLPVTRRVREGAAEASPAARQPTLNILVVVARPEGATDIGYRTISRPLLAALGEANLPVTVDLVRPGTWEALTSHLRLAAERHGKGWYQVVHFDTHGMFSDYGTLEQMRGKRQLLFSDAELAPFQGKRGFLFFETSDEGKAQPVAAEDVAVLLAEQKVPVAVLNACQSAMQTGSEASMAHRMAEAGIPVAVGMAYSVTVSAAEQAMPVLYGRMTGGEDPPAALTAARRNLYDHRSRRGYFDRQLDLADWMLPVMFSQSPLQIQLRQMTPQESAGFSDRAGKAGAEPVPEYGFVGRDLDIQAIEHHLLVEPDNNELVVQGMAGAGKSTLLRHLAWWWHLTGMVERSFVFSYENQAWNCAQIVRQMLKGLLDEADRARVDTMPEAAQLEELVSRLRANRYLLILDNFESVTAAPEALPNSLDPGEQQQLKMLLTRLRGGQTLVLLGSRGPETWLGSGGLGPGRYPLPGLDQQAASVLVERILQEHGSNEHLEDAAERAALLDIVELLRGYPLPLTVVLSGSASTRPSVTLAELKAGGSGADPAGLIHRALEYSFSKLNPALQRSLLLLAPFTSVIATLLLSTYQDLLQQDEIVGGTGEVGLRAALDHAVDVGLASPHPQLPHHVQLQPVLPYFLRSRLHGQPALSAALAQAHYQACYELGGVLHTFLESSDNPQYLAFGQAATQAEYANLRAALSHGLQTGQSVDALVAPLALYLDQTQQDSTRRELLADAIRAHREAVTQDQQVELAILHGEAGHAAVRQRRFTEARAHYEAELALREAAGDPAQGVIYHQLGWIAQEQKQFAEAEENYRAALAIFREADDMRHAAGTLHNLATLALEQQKFTEADSNARKALEIFLESGDELSAAAVYHDLGEMARRQERFADAEVNYAAAVDLFLEFGSTSNAARTYFSLAALAQEQQRNADAEANYRSALDIFLFLGDQHSAARAYAQLGAVAVGQQRWEEATENYRTAIGLFQKSGDHNMAAETYIELGNFQNRDQRFPEAESSYRKALQVFRESGKQDRVAGTHANLGSLAQQQQNYTQAEANYREALRIFADIEHEQGAALIYHNLGTLADAQSRYAEAEASYRKALDIRMSADPRAAANTAAGLATVLAKLGRNNEAARVLASSAVTWRQQSGQWPPRVLQLLRGERDAIGPDEFAAVMETLIPADLKEDFGAAVDADDGPGNSTIVDD